MQELWKSGCTKVNGKVSVVELLVPSVAATFLFCTQQPSSSFELFTNNQKEIFWLLGLSEILSRPKSGTTFPNVRKKMKFHIFFRWRSKIRISKNDFFPDNNCKRESDQAALRGCEDSFKKMSSAYNDCKCDSWLINQADLVRFVWFLPTLDTLAERLQGRPLSPLREYIS